MADAVQFHLEKMLPELQDLENRGIFTKVLNFSIHPRLKSNPSSKRELILNTAFIRELE